jgi:hypothetical protein
LGEAGDLSGFVHGNALLRHAGLNLAEASSGKWTGQMKISKRRRSRLRRFLFMATMSLVKNNSEVKLPWYDMIFSRMLAYSQDFSQMERGEDKKWNSVLDFGNMKAHGNRGEYCRPIYCTHSPRRP